MSWSKHALTLALLNVCATSPEATVAPSLSSRAWLELSGISSKWCVIKTDAKAGISSRNWSSKARNSSLPATSRPVVGSSNNSNAGRLMSALATRTRPRSPWDRCAHSNVRRSLIPTTDSNSSVRCATRGEGSSCRSRYAVFVSPVHKTCWTDKDGSIRKRGSTCPISVRRSRMSTFPSCRPKTCTDPLVGKV